MKYCVLAAKLFVFLTFFSVGLAMFYKPIADDFYFSLFLGGASLVLAVTTISTSAVIDE